MLMTLAASNAVSFNSKLILFRIRCSDSNPKRGFGSKKVVDSIKSSSFFFHFVFFFFWVKM